MTIMGLDYLKHIETKRANLAKEQENYRSNLANEDREYKKYLEQVRSDMANEKLKQKSLDETVRSNKEHEAIGWFQSLEQERSNKAREYETHRTNQKNEELKGLAQRRDYQLKLLNTGLDNTDRASQVQLGDMIVRNSDILQRMPEKISRLDVLRTNTNLLSDRIWGLGNSLLRGLSRSKH